MAVARCHLCPRDRLGAPLHGGFVDGDHSALILFDRLNLVPRPQGVPPRVFPRPGRHRPRGSVHHIDRILKIMRHWLLRMVPPAALALALLAIGGLKAAQADANAAPRGNGLAGSLDYLFELSAGQTPEVVDPRRIEKLLDFVLATKAADEVADILSRETLQPLAYHALTVNRALDDILRYAYHPIIPSHLFSLASVRCAYWKQVDGPGGTLPAIRVAQFRDAAPFVLRGIEYEEIAPDDSSGAYYSYDLRRTLIGFYYRGLPVWISLSRQADVSDVGRKGFAMGDVGTWDFIYSGQPGLTRPGMGWVQSYMYDSFSCAVYIQTASEPARVQVALLKWLRAGWQGMNFVRNNHIEQGLLRYAETFKEILENDQLPPVETMASAAELIDRMPLARLRALNRAYLEKLAAQYGQSEDFPHDWFEARVDNGDFIESLNPTHLRAVAFLEYMKNALGRDHPALARVRTGVPQ